MSVKSILPPNEKFISRTIEALDAKHLKFDDISKVTFDAMNCDASLLEHLAFDLDVSIEGLDEKEARDYLHNAREIKRLKGSVWAVKKAASSIFKEINVVSWRKAGLKVGTFKLEIDVTPEKSLSDENLNKTMRLVNDAKPISRHLGAIVMKMKNKGSKYYVPLMHSVERLNVLPKVLKDINIQNNQKVLAAIHSIETITIQPKGE